MELWQIIIIALVFYAIGFFVGIAYEKLDRIHKETEKIIRKFKGK